MDLNNSVTIRKIRNYTIKIDRILCIGAATCIVFAPKALKLDNVAKAVFTDSPEAESDEALINAAKSCPVAAITIIDDTTGKQLFP